MSEIELLEFNSGKAEQRTRRRTLTGCDVFGVLVKGDREAFSLPLLVPEDAALWIEVVLDVGPPGKSRRVLVSLVIFGRFKYINLEISRLT